MQKSEALKEDRYIWLQKNKYDKKMTEKSAGAVLKSFGFWIPLHS